MVQLDCRMYESIYPEPDDIVVATVTDIQEMGAYVKLLEYDNCQGMIMLSELSRRRIRSVNKLLRVGRQEVVAVVRVDRDKGYIDLSKRRVAPEDIVKMEEKWNMSRTVHSIVRNVAQNTDTDVEQLYIRWGWPLYRRYGHAYDGFRHLVSEPDVVLEGLDIKDNEREELLRNARRRLTAQAIKFRADFEVTCHSSEGIDAIRDALKAAERRGSADTPISIKIVAAPLYIMNATALHKAQGLQLLSKALDIVQREITERGGRYVVKGEPRIVSEKDEKLLSSLMKEAEIENEETDEEDDEEGAAENGVANGDKGDAEEDEEEEGEDDDDES